MNSEVVKKVKDYAEKKAHDIGAGASRLSHNAADITIHGAHRVGVVWRSGSSH